MKLQDKPLESVSWAAGPAEQAEASGAGQGKRRRWGPRTAVRGLGHGRKASGRPGRGWELVLVSDKVSEHPHGKSCLRAEQDRGIGTGSPPLVPLD